jgi:hypothetical protein
MERMKRQRKEARRRASLSRSRSPFNGDGDDDGGGGDSGIDDAADDAPPMLTVLAARPPSRPRDRSPRQFVVLKGLLKRQRLRRIIGRNGMCIARQNDKLRDAVAVDKERHRARLQSVLVPMPGQLRLLARHVTLDDEGDEVRGDGHEPGDDADGDGGGDAVEEVEDDEEAWGEPESTTSGALFGQRTVMPTRPPGGSSVRRSPRAHVVSYSSSTSWHMSSGTAVVPGGSPTGMAFAVHA